MSGKLSYEHVKSVVESRPGYKLVSKEYIGSKDKLDIQCPKGHIFQTIYNVFQQGRNCNICRPAKYTYTQIVSMVELRGWKYLENDYIPQQKYANLQCPEGHIILKHLHDFIGGSGCPICAGTKKHTFEYVKSYIEAEGYTLLSDNYKNAQTYLTVCCPDNHVYQVKWSNFKRYRCPYCAGNIKYTIDQVKGILGTEGYKFLDSVYRGSNENHLFQCPEGHIYENKIGAFIKGEGRCRLCSRRLLYSKDEKEVLKYVRQIYTGTILPNNRTVITNPNTNRRLELDIWLPDLNKAIEYNAAYWHLRPERKIIDMIKAKECKRLGIELLVIDHDSWRVSPDYSLIESFILS